MSNITTGLQSYILIEKVLFQIAFLQAGLIGTLYVYKNSPTVCLFRGRKYYNACIIEILLIVKLPSIYIGLTS